MKRQPDPPRATASFSHSLVTLCSSRSSVSSAPFLLPLSRSLSLSPSHSLPLSQSRIGFGSSFLANFSHSIRKNDPPSISLHSHSLRTRLPPLSPALPSPPSHTRARSSRESILGEAPSPPSFPPYRMYFRGGRGAPAKDFPAMHLKRRLVAGQGGDWGEEKRTNIRIRFVSTPRSGKKKKKIFKRIFTLRVTGYLVSKSRSKITRNHGEPPVRVVFSLPSSAPPNSLHIYIYINVTRGRPSMKGGRRRRRTVADRPRGKGGGQRPSEI